MITIGSPPLETTESYEDVIKEAVEIPLSREVDNYVCNYLYIFEGFDCDTVRKPEVYLVRFSSDSLLGVYYPGTNRLLLNRRLRPEYINSVMLHELVHHYGYVGGLKWGFELCTTEHMARVVTALYRGEEYSDDWREWYVCPKD